MQKTAALGEEVYKKKCSLLNERSTEAGRLKDQTFKDKGEQCNQVLTCVFGCSYLASFTLEEILQIMGGFTVVVILEW